MTKSDYLKVFLNTLEQQLQANSPSFVRTTLARLEGTGYSTTDAKALMAGIIAHQMAYSIYDDTPFDQQQYQQLLSQLPELPDLD